LMDALASGERSLDELVTATGCAVPQTLSALALLELHAAVERRGADRFARVTR
jgi:predicted Rossmann fold nucleotide-binding protein DprA/Smf involved in DNA uptake